MDFSFLMTGFRTVRLLFLLMRSSNNNAVVSSNCRSSHFFYWKLADEIHLNIIDSKNQSPMLFQSTSAVILRPYIKNDYEEALMRQLKSEHFKST